MNISCVCVYLKLLYLLLINVILISKVFTRKTSDPLVNITKLFFFIYYGLRILSWLIIEET